MESTSISIIKAKEIHADAISALLISAITELCFLDHQDDPQKLEPWLSNKTPENIKSWIKSPDNFSFVALNAKQEVIGIAMLSRDGEILLNYLLPGYLGQGIGKRMLKKLETIAEQKHLSAITAMSTLTALNFYKQHGFVENKVPPCQSNQHCLPIIKYLNPETP